jgi:excisionase family DNA binding protein
MLLGQAKASNGKGQAMEATQTASPYLTYKQAAVYCNVERTTIYRALKAGQLKASGPGSAVRFHRDELDKWMDSRNRT